MKICSKCKIEKEYFYFGKRSYSKDGFRSDCKECRKEDHIRNKEERNKKSCEYHHKNRDILLQKMSKYRYNRRNIDGKIIKKSIIGKDINEHEKVCSKCMSIKSKNISVKIILKLINYTHTALLAEINMKMIG